MKSWLAKNELRIDTHSLMNNFANSIPLSSLGLPISQITLHAVLSRPSSPTNKRSTFSMPNIIFEMILTYSNLKLMAYTGDAFHKRRFDPSLLTVIPLPMVVMLQQPKSLQKCFNLSSFGQLYSWMQEPMRCHVTNARGWRTLQGDTRYPILVS
jgi:hypothetical protein